MHNNYEDILALTDKQPQWYDVNGVPRFAPFHPRLAPNIYARHCFLLLIACQKCGRKFEVQMHVFLFERTLKHPKHLHYGDPPCHGCVGDTMNCDDLAVLEAWYRDPLEPWERQPQFEGPIV
jgi:hypothetical protein